ncbi:helix-turn-helix domain-containing protein [Aliiroseovarius sp. KMU-71]|uniref:helix-turn-helix domain-containing protein n=1 Tax=Aliiroseovarius sp. KMU-71 TaxID=3453123 RepID=UPI003F48970F
MKTRKEFPKQEGPDLSRRVPDRSEAVGTADATIREFCAEVRCSATSAWAMINSGRVKAYKVGNRVKIRRDSIEAMKARNAIKPKGAV